MIHQWRDDYFKLKLDDYILTFDDGLYGQIEPIFKICNIYPDIEIRYYVSTGIINTDDNRNYEECSIAHDNFFSNGDLSNYVSYDDLISLSKLKQVNIGLHGHNHLRLENLIKNKSLKDYFKIIEKDIEEMLFRYIDMYQNRIIKAGDIHYCTPYNYTSDLYNALLRKRFNEYFPDADLNIVGNGREDIDQLLKLI